MVTPILAGLLVALAVCAGLAPSPQVVRARRAAGQRRGCADPPPTGALDAALRDRGRGGATALRPGAHGTGAGRRRVAVAACLVAAAGSVAVLQPVIGLVSSVAVAAVVAVIAWAIVTRAEPAALRHRRERVARDVPLLAELLAAAVAAGRSPDSALASASTAVGGAVAEELAPVLAALRLGASPAEAWRALCAVPELACLAVPLRRAAESGSAVTGAVERAARDARATRRVAAQAAARRATVTVVAPLGLCFLPAFVLVGVVPLVVAIATVLTGSS